MNKLWFCLVLVLVLTACAVPAPVVTATAIPPTATVIPTTTAIPATATPEGLQLDKEFHVDYHQFPVITEADITSGVWAKADLALDKEEDKPALYTKWEMKVFGDIVVMPIPDASDEELSKNPPLPKNTSFARIENFRDSGIDAVVVGYQIRNTDGSIVSMPLFFQADFWDWTAHNESAWLESCLDFSKKGVFAPVFNYEIDAKKDKFGQTMPVKMYEKDTHALRINMWLDWEKTGSLSAKASNLGWGGFCLAWR